MYEKQVALLLQILPEVAKVEMFALHGGTCINLFVRDMVRLSVDIDLTLYQLRKEIPHFPTFLKVSTQFQTLSKPSFQMQ